MDCTFCRIIDGSTPAHIVTRTPDLVAFADHQPVRQGHLQLVPCRHVETFEELPRNVATALIVTAQTLAKSLKSLYQVERVGFAFTGFDVGHCHAHLIPLHGPGDVTSLRYFEADIEKLPRRNLNVSPDRLAADAAAIKASYDRS